MALWLPIKTWNDQALTFIELSVTYAWLQNKDGNQAYWTAWSTHWIATSAPGMYGHRSCTRPNVPQSTTKMPHRSHTCHSWAKLCCSSSIPNRSLQTSKNKNHQAMVTVQKQQAEAFGALAVATEQHKYDTLFAAILKHDGTNKEDCAICIRRI